MIPRPCTWPDGGRPAPLENWRIHMAVWGYDTWGEPDQLAFMCELGPGPVTYYNGWWDRTAADLAAERIDRGDGWMPVPEHWALPAVTDLRMRLDRERAAGQATKAGP